MDNFYNEIGKRMKSVRTALKMTQAKVAESAGIDSSFYGQIERGTNIPSLKTFVAIAAALNVIFSDLIPQQKKKQRLYETAIENILSNLNTKRKELVLSLVKDIAAKYKSK